MRTEILNSYIATVKNIESGGLVIPLMDAPIYAFSLYKGFDSYYMPLLINAADARYKTDYCATALLEQIDSLYVNIDYAYPAATFEKIADRLVPLFNLFDQLLTKVMEENPRKPAENRSVNITGIVSYADLCELLACACRSVNEVVKTDTHRSQMHYGRAQAFASVLRLMGHDVFITSHTFIGTSVYTIKSFTIDDVRTDLD